MFDLGIVSHNCIMTLSQAHIAKVRVTVYIWHIFFFLPDHYLSLVTWLGMILHAIVVHDQGVVVAGGICPVRTCLVSLGNFQGEVGLHPFDKERGLH